MFEMFRWLLYIEWQDGTRYRLARAVFYSARSFLGRSDMLLAALGARDDCGGCADRRNLMKAVTKKAIAYGSTRNMIAHSALAFRADLESVEWASPVKPPESGESLDAAAIRIAASNFRHLSSVAMTAALRPTLTEWRIEALLERVHKLPKLAHSAVENPMPPARKQRQKSSPQKS